MPQFPRLIGHVYPADSHGMQLMLAVAPGDDGFEIISNRPPDRLFNDLRMRSAIADRAAALPFPGDK